MSAGLVGKIVARWSQVLPCGPWYVAKRTRRDSSGTTRLYDRYASDSGHLNGVGARVAATAWLKAIAHASPG